MKDEIKEILDKLKDSVNSPIDTEVDQFTEEAYDVPNYFCLDPTTNDCKILLDYITNLQEENKELKGLPFIQYQKTILKITEVLDTKNIFIRKEKIKRILEEYYYESN